MTRGNCKANWTAVVGLWTNFVVLYAYVGRGLLGWHRRDLGFVGETLGLDGNTCNDKDMDLFYSLTKVSIGDGNRACFWDAPLSQWT
jgi:hypothetical protein